MRKIVIGTRMISFSQSGMVPTPTLRQHVAFLFYLWRIVHHSRCLIPLRLLILLYSIVIEFLSRSLNLPEGLNRVVELVLTQEDRGRRLMVDHHFPAAFCALSNILL